MERFDNVYQVWQPMKYGTAKKEEILDAALDSNLYGLQLKMDGSSYIWAKDLDGSVHLYGDKISKKTGEIVDKIDNVPHMKDWADKHFPIGTQFCVEIFSFYDWSGLNPEPQKHSTSKFVNSIMLSNPDKAAARQRETDWVGAYMFDCLYYDKEPIYKQDFCDRYKQILAFEHMPEIYDDKPHWLSFAEVYTKNKRERLSMWLSEGFEGGVLKLLHSEGKLNAMHHVTEIGETAKRPAHVSYKIKQMDTLDVVCLGVNYPEKEYKGKNPETYQYRDEEGNPVNRLWALHMIDAIDIGAWDSEANEFVKIGTVASGLDDEMRKRGFDDPDSLINHVFEITCMSIDKKAKTLRHPRLMFEREDKMAKDCLMNDIFG